MHENALEFLFDWKRHRNKKPLLITGHTGTGKTYLVKDFARQAEYDEAVYIDCLDTNLSSVFVPCASGQFLIKELQDITHKRIRINCSVIIFDNVQYAPDVLSFLPVFYKDLPTQHVIAVGRINDIPDSAKDSIEVYNLKPLSFTEFLYEYDKRLYDSYIKAPLAETHFHEQFDKAYRYYLVIGGMPECVNAWQESRDLNAVDAIKNQVLANCMHDYKRISLNFGERCDEAFRSLPIHLARKNQKFMLSHISDKRPARSYHEPVKRLIHDKYILQLTSDVQKDFVAFSFDTGLLKVMTGTDDETVTDQPYFSSQNMLAWNFLIQNHQGLHLSYEPDNNGRKNFLLCDDRLYRYDIDVSARLNIKRHSLDKKNRWFVFSEKPFFQQRDVLNIPIYMSPRLADTLPAYEAWFDSFN